METYKEFVKRMFPTLANTTLSATDKIKEIAKMYREQKNDKVAPVKKRERKNAVSSREIVSFVPSTHQVIRMPSHLRNQLVEKGSTFGGDLVVPDVPDATEAPVPVPTPTTIVVQKSKLPETVQDWQNMTDDELLKITPDDILDKLSEASFQIAFRQASTANPQGSFAISQAIKDRLFNNLNGKANPNKAALIKASLARWELMSWWIPEFDPIWKTDLIGVPKWWFKHYNEYSWVKSQVMLYGAFQDFMDTHFYKKYSPRLKAIKPPKKFARYMSGSIPGQERKQLGAADSSTYLHNIFEKYGQKWRVMFIQGDLSGVLTKGNDYYVYYIDCNDAQDYLDMLQEFYDDRDTLQPNEIIIMLNVQYRAAVRKREAELYSSGFQQGTAQEKARAKAEADAKAAEDAAAQASEDNSSSIWGTLGDVAMGVLSFL